MPTITTKKSGENTVKEEYIVKDTDQAKLEVIPAIASFYMHEEIMHSPPARLIKFNTNKVLDLKERVRIHQEKYSIKLANALFDYLCLASFGEARHADDKAAMMHPELDGGGRSEAYTLAQSYNPKNYLKTLANIFHEHWEDGYGGEPWAKITEHALEYYVMSAKQFVDYVVDLSHNGGVAFDKPIVLFMRDTSFYKMMLDVKLKGSLMTNWLDKSERELQRHERLLLDDRTYVFMSEACRLGILNTFALPHIKVRTLKFSRPVEWGDNEMFIDDLIGSNQHNLCCEACGDKINENEIFTSPNGDSLFCEDCFDNEYAHCHYCCDPINKAEAHEINVGHSNFAWACNDCAEANGHLNNDNNEDDEDKDEYTPARTTIKLERAGHNPQKKMILKMRKKYKQVTGRGESNG